MAPGARVGGPLYTVVVVVEVLVVDEVVVVLDDVIDVAADVDGLASAGSEPPDPEQATSAMAQAVATTVVVRRVVRLELTLSFWPTM